MLYGVFGMWSNSNSKHISQGAIFLSSHYLRMNVVELSIRTEYKNSLLQSNKLELFGTFPVPHLREWKQEIGEA